MFLRQQDILKSQRLIALMDIKTNGFALLQQMNLFILKKQQH